MTRINLNKCSIPRCGRIDIAVIYLHYPICERCWDKYAEQTKILKEKLKIRNEENLNNKNIKSVGEYCNADFRF